MKLEYTPEQKAFFRECALRGSKKPKYFSPEERERRRQRMITNNPRKKKEPK
jgi:hypothetical protein